jgi:hypothetical protein
MAHHVETPIGSRVRPFLLASSRLPLQFFGLQSQAVGDRHFRSGGERKCSAGCPGPVRTGSGGRPRGQSAQMDRPEGLGLQQIDTALLGEFEAGAEGRRPGRAISQADQGLPRSPSPPARNGAALPRHRPPPACAGCALLPPLPNGGPPRGAGSARRYPARRCHPRRASGWPRGRR